jgi:hypothetical protein
LLRCLLLILAFAISLPAIARAGENTPLTVQEYNRAIVPGHFYSVKGYVVDTYECPPCPTGAMCKPCAPDSFVLSDKNEPVCKPELCVDQARFPVRDKNHLELAKKTAGKALLVTFSIGGIDLRDLTPANGTPSSSNRPTPLSVQEFFHSVKPEGFYRIKGYIVDTFECPPCPKGAECEPCPPDYFVLSDKNEKPCAAQPGSCPGQVILSSRDATMLQMAKRGLGNAFIADVAVGNIQVRDVKDFEVEEKIKEMLSKDPELLEKNPAKWLQEHYDLQDKSLQLNKQH